MFSPNQGLRNLDPAWCWSQPPNLPYLFENLLPDTATGVKLCIKAQKIGTEKVERESIYATQLNCVPQYYYEL